jgi:TRAP-type C4-dicarboxylate transport system permease large subunit
VVVIFGLVMGGIAADWDWTQDGVQALFTPTEGAAVGAVLTGLYGIFTGGLTWAGFKDSVLATAQATAMIFFIVWGATLFNSFLAFTQAPAQLVNGSSPRADAPLTVLTVMLIAYLVFRLRDGFAVDDPADHPDLLSDHHVALDFVSWATPCSPEEAAIWFGILALIVVEVGLITPPVGMNLFIINSMARDIPMARTYAGVAPFVHPT